MTCQYGQLSYAIGQQDFAHASILVGQYQNRCKIVHVGRTWQKVAAQPALEDVTEIDHLNPVASLRVSRETMGAP